MTFGDALWQLRQSNPDVDYIMKVFEEADKVHTAAQIAMGQREGDQTVPVGSTDVVIAFDPDSSAEEQPTGWTQ